MLCAELCTSINVHRPLCFVATTRPFSVWLVVEYWISRLWIVCKSLSKKGQSIPVDNMNALNRLCNTEMHTICIAAILSGSNGEENCLKILQNKTIDWFINFVKANTKVNICAAYRTFITWHSIFLYITIVWEREWFVYVRYPLIMV